MQPAVHGVAEELYYSDGNPINYAAGGPFNNEYDTVTLLPCCAALLYQPCLTITAATRKISEGRDIKDNAKYDG